MSLRRSEGKPLANRYVRQPPPLCGRVCVYLGHSWRQPSATLPLTHSPTHSLAPPSLKEREEQTPQQDSCESTKLIFSKRHRKVHNMEKTQLSSRNREVRILYNFQFLDSTYTFVCLVLLFQEHPPESRSNFPSFSNISFNKQKIHYVHR